MDIKLESWYVSYSTWWMVNSFNFSVSRQNVISGILPATKSTAKGPFPSLRSTAGKTRSFYFFAACCNISLNCVLLDFCHPRSAKTLVLFFFFKFSKFRFLKILNSACQLNQWFLSIKHCNIRINLSIVSCFSFVSWILDIFTEFVFIGKMLSGP